MTKLRDIDSWVLHTHFTDVCGPFHSNVRSIYFSSGLMGETVILGRNMSLGFCSTYHP